jgi:hypothetical protein
VTPVTESDADGAPKKRSDRACLPRQAVHRRHPQACARRGGRDIGGGLPEHGTRATRQRDLERRETVGAAPGTGEEQPALAHGAAVERQVGDGQLCGRRHEARTQGLHRHRRHDAHRRVPADGT